MNRRPSLEELATFVRVAETGAFNSAARELSLSPSAVSKIVTRLERGLGIKLLHRTTRSVGLTTDGERIRASAMRLLAEAQAFQDEAAPLSATPSGTVRVSVASGFGRAMLAPRLSSLHQAYPDVFIDLSLDDRNVDLPSEGIDVAIRSGDLGDDASLIARRIAEVDRILCAAPEYLSARGRPKSIDDLESHACVNFRSPQTGRDFPWNFLLNGEPVRRTFRGVATIGDGGAVAAAAIGGLGVSQMPAFLAEGHLRSGALVELLPETRPRATRYSAIYLDRRHVAPRIRAVLDFLSRAFD
ncbi:MAG: LysR substrate-binding domain-containing protein [Pseudomonadota bacterium]